jgi:hypothetical protein
MRIPTFPSSSPRPAHASLPTLALVVATLVAGAAACSSSDGKSAAGAAGSASGGDATGAGGSAGSTGPGGGTGTAGGSTGGASPGGGAAGAGGGDPCAGPEFVALLSDLAPFQKWTSFYVPEAQAMFNELGGPRTIYINQLPPKGANAFPVGTMIVKVIDNGMPGGQQVFAMAKRGACFNADGAIGWEWFGLDQTDGVLSIQWRGVDPPPSAGYGPKGACNSCHAALLVETNDYVQDSNLRLHP